MLVSSFVVFLSDTLQTCNFQAHCGSAVRMHFAMAHVGTLDARSVAMAAGLGCWVCESLLSVPGDFLLACIAVPATIVSLCNFLRLESVMQVE